MIRAILFVEGAHMQGSKPPTAEVSCLESFGLAPEQRHLAQALVIDWTVKLATPERAEVEKAMEEEGEFEGLEEGRDDDGVAAERGRRVSAEFEWRQYHAIKNRPQILGTLTLTGLGFPGELSLRGVMFAGSETLKLDTNTVQGELVLNRASLGGLDLTGASLGRLSGDRLQVRDDFRAWHLNAERAALRGLRVGAGVYWPGARLRAVQGTAFDANAAEIGTDLFLRYGFIARSYVDLSGAQIGGQLDCTGGRFEATEKKSLDANGAEVGGTVFLRGGFIAHSQVDFVRARINGYLQLFGGRFAAASVGGYAVDLDSAKINEALILDDPWDDSDNCARIAGHVDLSNARCAVLNDRDIRTSKGESWLAEGSMLILNGFTYGRLGSRSPTSWAARKAWLDRQHPTDRKGKDFKPQPFEQLAQILREMGHSSDARHVGLSKQWRMHRSGNLSPFASLFRYLVLLPSGYGYRPGIPALLGVALMTASLFIFASAYRIGYMTPAQPHAALAEITAQLGEEPAGTDACLAADTTESVPPFHAAAYVIDAFIPLVDIDQESSWKPAQIARCGGELDRLERLDQLNPGKIGLLGVELGGFEVPEEYGPLDHAVAWMAQRGGLHWLQWLLMISGFAISALIAASLSGLIRRD